MNAIGRSRLGILVISLQLPSLLLPAELDNFFPLSDVASNLWTRRDYARQTQEVSHRGKHGAKHPFCPTSDVTLVDRKAAICIVVGN